MADDIVQRIIIQAVDQASQALASISATATQTAAKVSTAFAQVSAAPVEAAFAKTATAAKEVGNVFQTLGQTIIGFFSGLTSGLGQGISEAFSNIRNGAGSATSSLQTVSTASSGARREISAMVAGLNVMGAGLGGAASGFTLLASSLGPVGVAAAAAAVALAGIGKAALDAAENVRGLGQLADITGQSFERLSSIQQVFRQLGVSADEFNKSFTNLSLKLKTDAASIADELERSADAIATAANKVKTAELDVKDVQIQGERLQIQKQEIALQAQQLGLQGQQLNLQLQQIPLQARGLQLQGQQLSLNLSQVRTQLQYADQLQAIDSKRARFAVEDAEANLAKLQLQRQLLNGNISQEDFDKRMAQIDREALNRAIEKAKVDVDAAKTAEQMLQDKQEQDRQAVSLQEQQILLQMQMLPIQQQQLELQRQQIEIQQQQLEFAKQNNSLDARQNALDIQRNMVRAVQAEIDLRNANRDLIKAQANDLATLTQALIEAAKAGKEFKFPDATDAATKIKVVEAALIEMQKAGETLPEALSKIFKSIPDLGDKLNVGKALGISPEIVQAIDKLKGSLSDAADAAQKIGAGLKDLDRKNLDELRDAADKLSGSFSTLKDKLGAVAAPEVTVGIKALTEQLSKIGEGTGSVSGKLDAITESLNKLNTAAGNVKTTTSGIDLGKIFSFKIDFANSPAGQFSKMLEDFISEAKTFAEKAKAALSNAIKGLLDGIISPAGAAEAPGGGPFAPLVTAARDAVKEIDAIFKDFKPEFSSGADFTGVVDAARTAVNEIEAIFEGLHPAFSGSLNFDDLIGHANIAKSEIISLFAKLELPAPHMDFGGVIEAARRAAEEIKRIFEDAFGGQQFKAPIEDSLPIMKASFDGVVNSARQASQNIGSAFASIKPEIADDIRGIDASEVWAPLVESAGNAAQNIQSIFQKMDAQLAGFLIPAAKATAHTYESEIQEMQRILEQEFFGKGTDLFDGFVTAAKDATRNIESTFAELGTKLEGFLIPPLKETAHTYESEIQEMQRILEQELFGKGTDLFDGFVNSAKDATGNIESTFAGLGTKVAADVKLPSIDFTTLVTAAQEAATQIQTIFQQLGSLDLSGLTSGLSSAASAASELAGVTFEGLIGSVNSATSAFNSMASAASAAAAAAKNAASSSGGGDGGSGFAAGGMVFGPGGGDVIHALLSAGEFVINAGAVRHWGVDLFAALNGLRLPSSLRLPRFDLGGLVGSMALPRFAAGGLVAATASAAATGGRPVHVHIGNESFGPMFASENVAKQLERAAISRQTTSTGTRPRWYR